MQFSLHSIRDPVSCYGRQLWLFRDFRPLLRGIKRIFSSMVCMVLCKNKMCQLVASVFSVEVGDTKLLRKDSTSLGRAVAQAVIRCLPTAEIRVRVRAACGVCGGQSGTGAGFLRVLRFLRPIIIPPICPSSS
jgi:hypothetical protein